MEKSRKRETAEAIALVIWTLFSGGAGIVVERYHADGELAAFAAELSAVKGEAEIGKTALTAAQEGSEAAKWRLIESEQRGRELKRQLELALAAQAGYEELAKAVKDLTGKIKAAQAKTRKPVEKPQLDAPLVPTPAPVKSDAPAPKEIEPQAVAARTVATAVNWQQQMLDEHNKWRGAVKVVDISPLIWSIELEQSAQQVADQLAGNDCGFKHSDSGYGENLHKSGAMRWPDGHTEHSPKAPAQIVGDWGSEADLYNYTDNTCSGVCGHYTQIVWKQTKEVGCANARCGNNDNIEVCQYFPPGNLVGQKPF